MISEQIRKLYHPTIGIECHVQLKTKTKLFAAVGNDAREAPPNSLISHICVGLPGALPVLNDQAIKLSAIAAFALETEPQAFSQFERKHYFYPDLPKGYQITQYAHPIILGGRVQIEIDGQKQSVGIERANLEEDAGKNIHPPGADYSLVDLNRAGTPLLEIVSRPDIHSAAEAKAFARELYLLMKYSGVSDCDLYHGHMRFDVNISVSKEASKLGTRAEIKNLNSFRSVEGAVAYEIERQIELLEKGQRIVQETRGWDEAKQKTTSQRAKEEAHDYRYMPDPDIPPVELNEAATASFKKSLPKLPHEIRAELTKLSFEPNVIEDILDSEKVYNKIDESIKKGASSEAVRRIGFDSLEKPKTLKVRVEDHIKIAESIVVNNLSSTAGSYVLTVMLDNPDKDVDEVIDENAQVSDKSEIEKIVTEVITENPKVVIDIQAGQEKAIGFLVGQVMAKSKGQANPELAQKIIKEQLSKH